MQAVLAFCSAKELSVHIKSVLFIEDELWCTEQTDSVLTRWGTVGCSLKKKNNPVGCIPDIDVGLIVFFFSLQIFVLLHIYQDQCLTKYHQKN